MASIFFYFCLSVCLFILSVCLSGCLPTCPSDIYPSIYGDDQNSLTYLLILKWRGVNPAFVFLSLWKLLHLVCPSDPSTISIHVATLRTVACGYPQEVRETRSAVWNVDGWGQKPKPIHTRQTIRSPARPASCCETGGPSRDTFARLDSEINKAQWLKWPFNDFAMALRLVYYLFKHTIFYHLPQGNGFTLTLWQLTRRLMLAGARGPTADPSYLWLGPWKLGQKQGKSDVRWYWQLTLERFKTMQPKPSYALF